MNRSIAMGRLVWRRSFVAGGGITWPALCVGTWLERLRRLLLPAIFSTLREEYRRVVVLISKMSSFRSFGQASTR